MNELRKDSWWYQAMSEISNLEALDFPTFRPPPKVEIILFYSSLFRTVKHPWDIFWKKFHQVSVSQHSFGKKVFCI